MQLWNCFAAIGCRLALVLATVHCQDDGGLIVPDRGLVPRADARVQGYDGQLVMIPYAGEPVMLSLDASHSLDPDGRIAKFRWLSGSYESVAGASAAAARTRKVPEGADAAWPDDVERPSVTLNEGSYVFSLWVIDERGLVSAPDVVRIEVTAAAR